MPARNSALQMIRPLRSLGTKAPRRAFLSTTSAHAKDTQVHPIGGFYQAMLDYKPPFAESHIPKDQKGKAPLPKATPSKPGPPKPAAATPAAKAKEPEAPKAAGTRDRKSATTKASKETVQSSPAPKIIFNSRLNGLSPEARDQRLAALRRASTRIHGVLIPPKPEEPDNCCMSGCVNCVWDQYREDMESWSVANAEAERRIRATEHQQAMSVEDDGGGSENNWEQPKIAKDLWDDNLYRNVPVGIREFMKLEKRLKEPHHKERPGIGGAVQ